MIHVGDITKLNGATLEPVNCITGGSPCQDLSIAGKREGLAGERSGLFLEMVRVIKEMRQEDKKRGRTGINARPRFVIWENVPGAFTSNGGEDFRCVLEQFSRVADETITIPRPENGKWQSAGCIVGDNFSLAWRTFDAQYWGVPQRRKRIALVADFGGQCAAEILFEREGLHGHSDEGEQARKSSAGSVGESPSEADSYTLKIRGGGSRYVKPDGSEGTKGGTGPLVQKDMSATLSTLQDQTLFAVRTGHTKANGIGISKGQTHTLGVADTDAVLCIENHPNDSRVKIRTDGNVQTLSSRMGTGGAMFR